MDKVTVTSDGEVAIPRTVRDRLHWEAGAELSLDVLGEALVIKRIETPAPDWRTMRGMVSGGPSLTEALEQEHASELAAENARIHKPRA